ncbi:hypothetical protein ACLBOM_36680 [Escherichia coli]
MIHFTTMQYASQTCTIDAYALDDETQRSSVASNINHRYFRAGSYYRHWRTGSARWGSCTKTATPKS